MWSLMNTGAVNLPKESVNSLISDQSQSQTGGVAQSRSPQSKLEPAKKQGIFPWLSNLVGPPGQPGNIHNSDFK